MATYKGSSGIVKVGSSPEATVAEITSFSIEVSGDTIEDTQLTDTERTYLANKSSWTMSFEAHYDPTDTAGQGAMDVLSTVSIIAFPAGEDTSPAPAELTGSIIITGKSITNADGATTTVSITAQGTGTLSGI
jgi:hypothetical protein